MDKDEAATDDISMSALTSLLKDHKEALSAKFKMAISSMDSKLDQIQAMVSVHGQRLTSLESNADSVSDRLET